MPVILAGLEPKSPPLNPIHCSNWPLIPINAAYHPTIDQPSPPARQSYTQYDLVRKPPTLDALIGYFISRTYSLHLPILPLVFLLY